jgi:hypothetical protein
MGVSLSLLLVFLASASVYPKRKITDKQIKLD